MPAALSLSIGLLAGIGLSSATEPPPRLRLATFSADVTVPLGHGMMGGAWLSQSVADPLEAHGLLLLGAGKPVVFVAVDWCEIRNEAFDRWQQALADAAGTEPERVMVCTVHQHDAPVADLAAERLLRERQAQGTVCDPAFHEVAVQRVAKALGASLSAARRVTHLGWGEAQVERIASWKSNLLLRSNGTLVVCLAHANAPGDPKNNSRPWRMGSICFLGQWDTATTDYQWTAGARVEISPEASARGLMEPEVAELNDGRLLVVWRGSTHGWDGTVAKTPGRKFHSLSHDGGRTSPPTARSRISKTGRPRRTSATR